MEDEFKIFNIISNAYNPAIKTNDHDIHLRKQGPLLDIIYSFSLIILFLFSENYQIINKYLREF